jgi:hypothetical protein
VVVLSQTPSTVKTQLGAHLESLAFCKQKQRGSSWKVTAVGQQLKSNVFLQ